MSTKPSAPFVWDSTLTHIVAVTSGHATSGFVNNEIPGSGELNSAFNVIGTWTQYLSDGVFSGNVEITGNLKVDGTTEAVGALTADATSHLVGDVTLGGEVHRLAQRRRELLLSAGQFITNTAFTSATTNSVPGVSSSGAWSYRSHPICEQGERLDYLAIRIQTSAGTVTVNVTIFNGRANTLITQGTWTVPVAGAGFYETATSAFASGGVVGTLDADSSYILIISGSTTGELIAGFHYGVSRP